ncbi:MAG TPA: hypothetical protein PLD23_13715 [Armatimonadota bacterium]|nr:hypothetical protein [Armatimonadota bacterium]HQK94565.1 hypothetical protein [Armatimonadota bacterium]
MKRIVLLGLAVFMLAAPIMAGCKSSDSKKPSPEAPADQQKLGKSLIDQVKKGN